MKNFLLVLSLVLFSVFATGQVPVTQIDSGSTAISAAIATINVARSWRYGVAIKYATSGTIVSSFATLQGSMDGTNFFAFPIGSTGDIRTSGTIATATASSGLIYLEKNELNVNYIRVFYNPGVSGATLIIQQISKTHDALK